VLFQRDLTLHKLFGATAIDHSFLGRCSLEPLPSFPVAAGFGFSFLGFLGSRLLRFCPFAMIVSPCR
jgi:hypothetical protein